ncbi:hypothetical protein ANANG_G00090170 [Anguilla anguilla]|uniref:FERM domain-containing protein n=1 Tax=Anguilla anguilla TaxID=7936 RepID=A0A9D3MR75_ANGAN|nr:hypothetical protein ANANG_G00090170 [Anguilla anguilla]
MGEIEGSYRVLQTPGTRLGAQRNAGISTLEPGQNLSTAMARGKKGQGNGLHIRVQGLDEAQEFYDVETKADGQMLLSEVFKRCNLIESDYFGLEFMTMKMNWAWLEPMKLIVKQVRRPPNTTFRLSVKFFPPDPGQLQEENTRYLFALQVKRDLIEGRLICSDSTAALVASHLVQSEIGDYDDMADREFLKMNKVLPNQEALQDKIMELHRRHLGQTPAESDFQVLEIARKLEMYGVRFHPAADREGTKINLSVAHMGLQVFQGNTKINTFNWSKIRKLSFKRKKFLIKLHLDAHGPHQDTLEFRMPNRDQCKMFWKNCVEYHSFFRLFDQPQPKSKAILFSRGSSFRYSGRTQKQLVDFVRDNGSRRTPYQRRNSRIHMSSRSLMTDVPKKNLSFSESLRVGASPSSVNFSFHSLHASSAPPRMEPPNQPTHQQLPARPPSPQRRTPSRPPPPHYAFQGATCNRAAGDCSPPFVCVESSASNPRPSQNGNDDAGQEGRGGRAGVGGGERKGSFTAEIFEAELLRARKGPPFPIANPHLQVTEEFIDDDPAEISFFGGGVEAYSYGFEGAEKELEFGYGEGSLGNPGPYDGLGLEELNGDPARYPEGGLGRSETSSLVNNRSDCSSLDNLPLSSAADSLSLGFSGPDLASLRLPGSDNPSEASSMVNFPAYSVRSEASSAMQFSDLVEQLEQLSYPPTATEGSGAGSSDSDSDWGSDGGLPPDQNLFYNNPLVGGPNMEGFLLECHNLRSMALGDQPEITHIKM